MKTEEEVTKPRTGIVHFEKRKYPRFELDLPLEYRETDSPHARGAAFAV